MTSVPGVPKILGSDAELGNFIDGVESPGGSGAAASRLLLWEVEGVPAVGDISPWAPATARGPSAAWTSSPPRPLDGSGEPGDRRATNAQDWGRLFLPGNGGCVYIDLDHLELAAPETFSAFDYVAYTRAMLRVAREAVHRVNARMRRGYRVRAVANCSDGHGHSYGAHLSVLLTRAAWDAITRRKPHHLACLAAFQASSIVFTGAGKVGSENGRPWADYQLSQRADFLESFLGEQTTYNRPLVNARDEPLCGGASARRTRGCEGSELARLHVIFFDATLCHVATLLRAGTMQIVTAMLEAGHVPAHLALDDPLEALQAWSRDPSLAARARLVSGEAVTAIELQRRFVEAASLYAATPGFEQIVPRAGEILQLWADTLDKLGARDFEALARRIDWVLKREIMRRTLAARPSLCWTSPELRHLDQLYASVDETEGLYWACERSGLTEAVVSEARILHAIAEPPDDTRAWTRAMLLRHAGASRVEHVDWDRLDIRLDEPRHGSTWSTRAVVHLPCPYSSTRRENAAVCTAEATLESIVETLEAERTATVGLPSPHFVN